MSKKIRIVLALLVASCLLTTSVLVVSPAGAAQRRQAPVAANSGKTAAIVAATVAVLKETSEIRELSILHPVKSGAQTRADIERMILHNLDEQNTPAELHATETSLKKLGMVAADFQYRTSLIKLLTEQVAGYYDPKTQEFFLADWIDLDGQKPVMAHELTHALQDQHFNLRRFEHWPKGDSDAELAAHALIEGDATLAMTFYLVRYPLVALAFYRSINATGASDAQFKQWPRMLRESLVFPYLQGSEWATALYKHGGWGAVSQAFTELPQSTEQILHPEKYFAHAAPVKVNLPDVRGLLGAKWKRLSYDVNGEWGYYLILDQYLNAAVDSRRAAAGWGGDRYEIYEGAQPGDLFLAQLSVWDTENDAREFFDAYAKRTKQRYEKAQLSEVPAEAGQGVQTAPNAQTDRHEWTTSEGGVVLELRGKRVLILEGVPANTSVGVLTKALWQ